MPSARKTNWFGWFILILLLGGAGWGGWWYYKKKTKVVEITYRTAQVTKGDIVQSVTAAGQLNPMVNVQVGSQVSGIIDKLYVDFNSKVTNGQIIAQLDPATYKARVTQAEAELFSSQASLELAEFTAKRSTELNKAGLLPKQDFERAVVELHQAEAAVKIRQALLESSKVDMARTTIYAPIDGMVISRNVDVGQTVAASFSAPTLFLIANDLAKMQIDALVSEADLGGVETNLNVTFQVEAYPTTTFKGKVLQVRNAPITNQNVVFYDTVIEVSNPELKLKPGMTASVSIITSNRTGVVMVPNAALRFKPPEGVKITGDTNALQTIKMINGETNYVVAALPERMQGFMKPYDKDKDGLISPAEQKEMMNAFAAMAGGGGGGAGGAGGGRGMMGSRGSQTGQPKTQTVYLMESTNRVAGQPVVLKAVQVKTGVSDSTNTEIYEGLKPGDLIVVGSTAPPPDTSRSGMGSPMSGPFGGGSRRRF